LLITIALMAAPAVALVWLGWRLVQQDRMLEREQRRERSERAAEAFAASLGKAMAPDNSRVAAAWSATPPDVPQGAALITMRRGGAIQSRPASLILFQPFPSELPAPPELPFQEAEALEFTKRDVPGALRQYRRLAAGANPGVMVGAQIRLARLLRSTGQSQEALAVYAVLASQDPWSFSGVPVSLLAVRSRCILFEELGRKSELEKEARRLLEGLRTARWAIDKAAYLHYLDLAGKWANDRAGAGQQAELVSATAEWLWGWWKNQQGTGTVSVGEAAVLWRVTGDGLAAWIAGPDYQRREWFAKSQSANAWVVSGNKPAGLITLSKDRTGLPWTISASDEPGGGFDARRRLLLAGLTALLLLLTGGAWLATRAISKELAVARLQTEFVSAVSHEFRTPLTSLQQFNELLSDDTGLSLEDRQLFHQAQDRATQRLRRLVESLLDFGRMESGRKAYRLEPLDAGEMLESVVASFCAERNVTIASHAARVPVEADREALSLALWNLLDNAVKYGGKQCDIEAAAERNGHFGLLRVTDRGPGIPASEQRRIFQKFVRGESAVRDSVPGTGLGLAMVEHIARVHHGTVDVTSEPGMGSTFTIKLPLKETAS
jgi:signal transduction histidine kinase